MSDLIPIGGLWESRTKKGELVLSGSFGRARFVIMPNGYKKTESHPDYNLYVSKKEDRKQDDRKELSPDQNAEIDNIPF